MPSLAELYNQEVLEGHREALAALRELLAGEKDPAERRKLANAILRTRPVKPAKPDQTPVHPSSRAEVTAPHRQSGVNHDRGPDEDVEFDELASRSITAPDRENALRDLHTSMLSCATSPASPVMAKDGP